MVWVAEDHFVPSAEKISAENISKLSKFTDKFGIKKHYKYGLGQYGICHTLSQHEQLLVLGKSTGEYLQKNQVSDEDIVKKYGVQFVLGGGIQVSGNKTRINVELKDLAKNDIIWSENLLL